MQLVFVSALDLTETMARLEALLEKRGLHAHRRPQSLSVPRVPFGGPTWRRHRFSRDNWVGVNPFLSFSSLELRLVSEQSGTQILLTASRARIWWQAGLMALAALFFGAVEPLAGGLFLGFVVVVGAFSAVVVARHATQRELRNALRAPAR